MWTILGDVATGESNSSSFADKIYVENGWNKMTYLTQWMERLKASTYSLMLTVSNKGVRFEFPEMRVKHLGIIK